MALHPSPLPTDSFAFPTLPSPPFRRAAMGTGFSSKLIKASKQGDLANVQKYLAKHTGSLDVSTFSFATDKDGSTAIMLAAGGGHLNIVVALAEAGRGGLNVQNTHGQTALMLAGLHAAIVQVLIRAGAALDVRDKHGWTALMRVQAVRRGAYMDVVRALVRGGAALDMIDEVYGETVLMTAAKDGCFEVAQEMIHAGAALGVSDKYGGTALINAIKGGHTDIVRALIHGGADLNPAGGMTSLRMAAVTRSPLVDITAILKEAIDIAADPGTAIRSANTEAELLLAFGAILADSAKTGGDAAVPFATVVSQAKEKMQAVGPEVWVERVAAAYGRMVRELKKRQDGAGAGGAGAAGIG